MPAKVILNPYSGRWSALKRLDEVKDSLGRVGLEYELSLTDGPGHATMIAQSAQREGFKPILIAGGDGTIGEVLNGLNPGASEGTVGPIGIIPLGTANDFVVNVGLPINLYEAAKSFTTGKTKHFDLGMVNSWVFANNSAVGLEPLVTQYNIQMVRLRGILRYMVAAIRAILSKREWQMRIIWDEGDYEGLVSLISVGNNPLTGGLFRTVPDADPTDGLLSFVHGYAPTRRKMFSLLPSLMSGTYVDDPNIHQYHTKLLKIHSIQPTALQADGELRSEGAHHFEYEILPSKLELLIA